MSDNTIYCKVDNNSKAANAIKSFRDQFAEVRESWFAFAKKYGSEEIYCDDWLRGIKFDYSKQPEGWSNANMPGGFYRPCRRIVCMEAFNEYKVLKSTPSGIELAKMLGIEPFFGGNYLSTPGFHQIGGEIILSIHKKMDVPEGAAPMKMSEYWQMKEENDGGKDCIC